MEASCADADARHCQLLCVQHTWPSVQQGPREEDFSGLVQPGAAVTQHLPFQKEKEKEDGRHKALMDFPVIRCWTDVSVIRQVPLRSKRTQWD